MSNKKFFSGNSLQQAVLQAARHFQLLPEEVAYEKVERRHGFLKVRRRAVIAVDVENPRRPEQEGGSNESTEGEVLSTKEPEKKGPSAVGEESRTRPEERAVDPEAQLVAESVGSKSPEEVGVSEEQEKRDELAPDEAVEAGGEAVRELLALGGLDLEAEVGDSDGQLKVELSGADEELLLEDRGRVLMSIQHLMPRLLRGLKGSSRPCSVDCDNFHEIRAEQLRDLAQRVASEVRDSRRSQTLEPMAPDERRIVHLTLADDSAVETASQGSGLFKRVQIRPLRSKPQGFGPYNR